MCARACIVDAGACGGGRAVGVIGVIVVMLVAMTARIEAAHACSVGVLFAGFFPLSQKG